MNDFSNEENGKERIPKDSRQSLNQLFHDRPFLVFGFFAAFVMLLLGGVVRVEGWIVFLSLFASFVVMLICLSYRRNADAERKP